MDRLFHIMEYSSRISVHIPYGRIRTTWRHSGMFNGSSSCLQLCIGPGQFQNGGQIHTNFLHYKPAYNYIMHSQSEYIPGENDE